MTQTTQFSKNKNQTDHMKQKKLASWNDPVVLVEFCENKETFQNVTFSNILFSWMNNIFFFVAA